MHPGIFIFAVDRRMETNRQERDQMVRIKTVLCNYFHKPFPYKCFHYTFAKSLQLLQTWTKHCQSTRAHIEEKYFDVDTFKPNTNSSREIISMSDKMIPSLLRFPVELVSRILENLDQLTLLLSVRDVCAQL
jgi:hypothetical protein